jgi:hypothetical protein
MTRPEGQPGTVWYGYERTDQQFGEEPETVTVGLTYPAVKGETLWLWRDGQWIDSPGYARYFVSGEEWQADCDHEHTLPWQTCDTEAECLSLRREDARKWADR